jgi:hypothetical protein
VALALSLLKAHNVPTIVVSHAETVADPGAAASRVAGFLGLPLDIAAMAAVVDSMLYRERNAASGVRYRHLTAELQSPRDAARPPGGDQSPAE